MVPNTSSDTSSIILGAFAAGGAAIFIVIKIATLVSPGLDAFFGNKRRHQHLGIDPAQPITLHAVSHSIPREWAQRIETLEASKRLTDERYEKIMNKFDHLNVAVAIIANQLGCKIPNV